MLFWPTLALAALGVGVLGSFDVAGWAVVDSAYPALVLGVIAAMLLLGAFWGRAGGLIALGLVAAVATAGAATAGEVDGTRTRVVPTTAEQVRSTYELGRGELVVDLTEVADVQALDGRDIRVEGAFGRIEVVLPTELDVEAQATVVGPGNVEVFGSEEGGIDLSLTGSHDGGAGAPDLDLLAEVGVGEVVVRTE